MLSSHSPFCAILDPSLWNSEVHIRDKFSLLSLTFQETPPQTQPDLHFYGNSKSNKTGIEINPLTYLEVVEHHDVNASVTTGALLENW